ncbi:MAG: CBS domain-containing protein, partial [Candidatus Ranarchaeia archaeon]
TNPEEPLEAAVRKFETHSINALPVVNQNSQLQGILIARHVTKSIKWR